MNDYINEYYSNHDEDGRLDRKHNRLEYLTTMRYINKYLKTGMKVLEVGAGTGRYSISIARQGHYVDAVELIAHNIKIFESKLLPTDTITIKQGNALDMSFIQDNFYDVTLVLGPMYHMYTEKDKKKVIEEALRVTKPNGTVFIAYISHDSVIVNWGLIRGNFLDGVKKEMFTKDYKCKSTPKELFSMLHVDEFAKLVEDFNVKHLHTVGTDGVAPFFVEQFKEMSDEMFQEWEKYHYHTCERKDLIGMSNHILYIGKKTAE